MIQPAAFFSSVTPVRPLAYELPNQPVRPASEPVAGAPLERITREPPRGSLASEPHDYIDTVLTDGAFLPVGKALPEVDGAGARGREAEPRASAAELSAEAASAMADIRRAASAWQRGAAQRPDVSGLPREVVSYVEVQSGATPPALGLSLFA
jgi:hypothetical protein